MPLTLVLDPADQPARFGLSAARLAMETGARLLTLPARFDLARDADAEQYVFAAGGLGPSGLFFAERILGRPVEATSNVDRIVAAAREEDVVVPIHAAFGQDGEALKAAAFKAGLHCREVSASLDTAGEAPAFAVETYQEGAAAPLVIALLGTEHDHWTVYPAALASLEDAARALGVQIAVRFLDPKSIGGPKDLPHGAAGILLPGGSDMENVAGQIVAARHALTTRIPILGLCLGMQTMTTAFAQTVLGSDSVNLTEADPRAEIKSFVAMADETEAGPAPLLPAHRVGEEVVQVVPGTHLAALVAAETMQVRCNHRYRLAPQLRASLEEAGLVIDATSHDARVADGIELPGHPFYMGLQGHPELGHPAGRPHPLFTAFLRAADGQTHPHIRKTETI